MNTSQTIDPSYGFNLVASPSTVKKFNDLNNPSDYINYFKSVINNIIEFKAEQLIEHLNDVSRETKIGFITTVYYQLTSNQKNNKTNLKLIRRELLILVLAKLNYKKKIQNIFLKDKSSRDMLEDIHTLATCYVESRINIDILDLFIINSNNELEALNEFNDSSNQDIKSNNISNREQIETLTKNSDSKFTIINDNIKLLIEQVLNCQKQNETLMNKLTESSNNDHVENIKKRKYAIATRLTHTQSEDEDNEEEENENELINNNDVIVLENIEPPSNIEPHSNTEQPSIIKTATEQTAATPLDQNTSKVVGNNKKPTQPLTYANSGGNNHNQKYSLNKTNNNNKSNKTKPQETKSILVNGINKIVYTNQIKSSDNVLKTNEHITQKKYNKNNLIIGTANSDVKALRAVSKPFYYHLSRWNKKTDLYLLRQHISGFAKVISLEEMNTDLKSRSFKSFKLAIESYSKDNLLKPENWPGGSEIRRWQGPFKHNNKIVGNSNQIEANHLETNQTNNVTTENSNQNSQKSLQNIVTNNNRTTINNQMIDKTKSSASKKEFLNSLKPVETKTSKISLPIKDQSLVVDTNNHVIPENLDDSMSSQTMEDDENNQIEIFNLPTSSGAILQNKN